MRERAQLRTKLALATGMAVLVLPSSASGATTIGQTNVPFGCGAGPSSQLQDSVAGAPSYTVPSGGGVITSWAHHSSPDAAQNLRLKVFRRTLSANQFLVVGHSNVEVPDPSVLNSFATSISVQEGDVIGLAYSGTDVGCAFASGMSEDRTRSTPGDPAPGTMPTFGSPSTFIRTNVSAVVEPDCDSDGLGDETQDAQLFGGACPKFERTLTLDANKGKVEKKKKVRLSGQLEATGNDPACEASQTIEILRTGLKGGTPKPVTTDQTDAQGNFATKVKVRKSSLYTGEVDESSACERETSDTEKVRVQKPKAAKEA